MHSLLQQYGLSWSGGKRSAEMRRALFHILRGHSVAYDGRGLIAALLELLLHSSFAPPALRASLRRLVRQQQSARDDSLAILGQALLARVAGPDPGGGVLDDTEVAEEDPRGFERSLSDRLGSLPGDDGTFRTRASAALRRPEPDLLPAALPAWVRQELERRMALWSGRYRVDRLASSIPSVVVYRRTPVEGGVAGYASIAWLEDGVPLPERDAHGHIVDAPNLEKAAVQAGRRSGRRSTRV
jgi:hypothetical protein